MLLAGAGLLIRSYINVESVDTGFSQSTVTTSIQLDARYSQPQSAEFYRNLFAKLTALPGVKAVGGINALPLTNSETLKLFQVEGYANEKDQLVQARWATPQYFSAMSIPLVAGRFFTNDDTSRTDDLAIINQAFARKILPMAAPLAAA